MPFIDEFLHRKETYLTPTELAKSFDECNKKHGINFTKIQCSMNSFRYKSLIDSSGNSILWEEINFEDLQSFLYFDFFNGIRNNYIPNKCKNCGKYFLIQGGKYFSYCDRKLKEDPTKTCRDVGSRRRYDDKCKNDPIWQTYNRAYGRLHMDEYCLTFDLNLKYSYKSDKKFHNVCILHRDLNSGYHFEAFFFQRQVKQILKSQRY